MVSSVALLIVIISLFYAFITYRAFSRNLAAAKSTGLLCIQVPVFFLNRAWLITQHMVIPYLRKIPQTLTNPWLELTFESWFWTHQYTFFETLGVDTFLTVSPGGIVLSTAEPAVINQITSRAKDFPKPIKVYETLNIYGKNVVSTEGHMWRHQRRITSPSFSEKTNRIVFSESLRQVQAMLESWIGNEDISPIIHTVAQDTARLSLHVISKAGFGKNLSWPGSEGSKEESASPVVGEGHEWSYAHALAMLHASLIWLLVVPKFLLSKKPNATPLGRY